MFWAPKFGFLMVLAMSYFLSRGTCAEEKYVIAKNEKIVSKTIKKPNFGSQNIVSTPFHTVLTPFLTTFC